MKKTVIERDGYRYKWCVRGLNETSCINDIESNHRIALPDHIAVMFAERYGCVAEVEEVRVMTHNQYQEYLKSNVNRLHTEEAYTMENYKKDAARVDVLDFDLSKFNLPWPENIVEAINDLFSSETVNERGNLLLKGHVVYDSTVYVLANKLDCNIVCDNGFNGFFKNDENKCVLEFCEGDIYLTLCETKEAYNAEVESFTKFYKIEEVSLDEVLAEATVASEKTIESLDKDLENDISLS